MASIKVSYSDLEDAFLLASYDRHYWLDKQTGRVLYYGSEAAKALEEDDLSDLPDWMDEEVKAAREVLRAFGELPGQEDERSQVASGSSSVNAQEGDHKHSAVDSSRYVSIEQIPSHEAFQFMTDFIDDVRDAPAREALSRALAGRKPFRRFKDALLDFPKMRERWFEYEASRRRQYIEEWAGDECVEINFSGSVL